MESEAIFCIINTFIESLQGWVKFSFDLRYTLFPPGVLISQAHLSSEIKSGVSHKLAIVPENPESRPPHSAKTYCKQVLN